MLMYFSSDTSKSLSFSVLLIGWSYVFIQYSLAIYVLFLALNHIKFMVNVFLNKRSSHPFSTPTKEKRKKFSYSRENNVQIKTKTYCWYHNRRVSIKKSRPSPTPYCAKTICIVWIIGSIIRAHSSYTRFP